MTLTGVPVNASIDPAWAPKTSGIRDSDEARSLRLAERDITVAQSYKEAQRIKPRQAFEIAADAKAAVADEIAHAVEHRQSRQFHAQPRAAIDRPVERDAAPGVAGGDGLGDAAFRIETEHLGDLAPEPAEA